MADDPDQANDADTEGGAESGGTRLPLFPLPDVVHFPRTELRLQITEPRYKRLVLDLVERQEEDARWIGVVLLKPGWVERYEGRPEVFPGGTAGKLLDVDMLPDGRANILLYGDYRFELKRELRGGEYRQAVVRPIEEPWLNEKDAGIVAVRHAILENLQILAAELGDAFPFQPGATEGIGEDDPFEELVNRIAADIDVPALRKLQLLIESLPERGLSVLSILRSRKQVVDLLRPFRHLAGQSNLN
jgi:Lon protease-like protein